MPTLGYHDVKSGFGLWLPGDDRGHWSEALGEHIGFCEPHMLHSGDPVRLRMAQERMKHAPVRLTGQMIRVVEEVLAECAASSPWKIVAASIEPHMRWLITFSPFEIHRTLKWIYQQTTKAIHQRTDHSGPVWCKNDWCSYIFDERYYHNVKTYIERHNVRRGVGPRPYAFLAQ